MVINVPSYVWLLMSLVKVYCMSPILAPLEIDYFRHTASSPCLSEHVPYVLIGAGTASFAAAKAILEKDPAAKILIVGEEGFTPYSRPPLSKQLWFNEDHEAARQLKYQAAWAGGKVVE